MIRMLVTDIDGTLMPIGGRMSARTAQAIRALIAKGVLFVPASGRTLFGAIKPFADIGIDCPIISANGGRADAHCRESILFEDRMDKTTAQAVCARLIEAGCYMTSYVGTDVHVLYETNGYGSTCVKVSEALKNAQSDIETLRHTMRSKGTDGPYKFEAYSDDKALLKTLKNEFTAMGLSVSGAFSFNLEIMAPGAGKGKAVKRLSRMYGIDKSEIMALGDGTNDITLLEASGLPVAMQNGADALKHHAEIIAPSAENDGAACIIEKYILGEQT